MDILGSEQRQTAVNPSSTQAGDAALSQTNLLALERAFAKPDKRVIYTSSSPLLLPKQLCRDAVRDLRASVHPAIRLFRQNTAHRYRRSSLGLFWAFAPTAAVAAAMTLRHNGQAVSALGGGVPNVFYAVFGLLMAQTFLEAFNSQRSILTSDRQLLIRHTSAIEVLILSGFSENLFSLCVKIPIVALVFVYCGIAPAATLPFGMLGLLSILLLGTSAGVSVAPWNALKHDLNHMMAFAPWILFAVTPIFLAPGTDSRLMTTIYQYNPLAWTFDSTRCFTYGTGDGSHVLSLLLSLLLIGVSLPFAWLMCRIARPYVIEQSLS